MDAAYASNLRVHEGVVNGTQTFNFPWSVVQLIVTNDGGGNLNVEFGGSDLTLKAAETLTLHDVRLDDVTLTGTNVAYRVWGLG